MPPKRACPFQSKHEVEFGLRVTQRHPRTKCAVSVECRFCHVFGREAKVGAKRKPTSNVHYFTAPFRVELYRRHAEGQHPTKWTEYVALSSSEKSSGAFFAGRVPFINTLDEHLDPVGSAGSVHIEKQVVEIVLGDILLGIDSDDDSDNSNDNDDSVSMATRKKRALAVFKPTFADDDPTNVVDYTCRISNTKAFDLTIRFVSCGATFRLASRLIRETQLSTKMGAFSNISDKKTAGFVRMALAMNLQRIACLLRSSWAFAIALDGATHASVSYLDLRVRLLCDNDICNFHLLAMPLLVRHTGEAMFDLTCNLLDVLCPDWHKRVIGCTSDGARNMTGRHAGIVTRLQQVAEPNFIRVWCLAHQVDLVIGFIYDQLLKEPFFSTLTALIAYLRRQQNLVSEMRSTCPKVALTRWLSMSKNMLWFKKHRIRIFSYLDDKRPACTPTASWWVLCAAVQRFSCEVAITFKLLQGLPTHVAQQRAYLTKLFESLLSHVGGRGPLIQSELELVDEQSHVISGEFVVSHASIREFIHSLGSFVSDQLGQLDKSAVDELLLQIGQMYMVTLSRLLTAVAERDASNGPDEELPPVTPRELVHTGGGAFCAIVRKFSSRLHNSGLTPQDIEAIEESHQDLLDSYRRESVLRDVIDSTAPTCSFKDAWAGQQARFMPLFKFCGGIASVFPGTATVESDFSVLRREKNVFRQNLTDFGLASVMHARQYDRLCQLQML